MHSTIVLYSSRYGAARQYAHMLAESLGCSLYNVKEATPASAAQADQIILCGGIYAGGISGISWFKKNKSLLKDKKIVVFAVGASPYDEKSIQQLKEHNLKGLQENTALFYGRGAWDESVMSFKDRTLCRMLQKMVAKKDPAAREPWEFALLEAAGRSCSWIDKSYLEPLYKYLAS